MNKSKLKLKRRILRRYIRNNSNCTCRDIKKDTKLKIERVYKNLKVAYEDAGVPLSKNLTKRNKGKQKRDVINFIKNNPGCLIAEIQNKTKVNVIRTFGSILNAYKSADVKYPEREITSGVMNPFVVKRCHEFEKRIITILSGLGEVKPKVRISDKIVDCLFSCGRNKFVVEIKDFREKNNITMYEIKQLIKYMDILNYRKGLLVCPRESFPKRKNSRNLYIGNKIVYIISEEDLRGRSINLWV